MRQLEHPVLLIVVAPPLCAGEHGVVVMNDDGPRARVVEIGSVDRGRARHHAVGRIFLPQRLDVIALVLEGGQQRPVFLEGAGIDQPVDILARHPVAPLMASGDGLGAVPVQRPGVARDNLFEVRSDEIRIDLPAALGEIALDIRRLDESNGPTFPDHVTLLHRNLADDSTAFGPDLVLHLHRLDHGDRLARQQMVALGDEQRDDSALDGRRHASKAGRIGRRLPVPCDLGGLDCLVVCEERQRVRAVHAGARETVLRAGVVDGSNIAGPQSLGRGSKRGNPFLHPAGVGAGGGKILLRQHIHQEEDIGRHPLDAELGERPPGPCRRIGEIGRRRMTDHLGKQRIESGAGAVAGIAETVHPHAGPARRFIGVDPAGPGPHRAVRRHRFHIHTRLDRITARTGGGRVVQTQIGKRGAAGQPELGLDQIDAGNSFRHRMFHL